VVALPSRKNNARKPGVDWVVHRSLRVPDSLLDLAGLRVDAEDFLAAVLSTAAQPIWVVDPEGVIRFANPAAIAALGYDDADELLGRRSHETIHHSHPDGTPYPSEDCPMLLPRATGEPVSSDLDWFFRRDGSMFPVSYVSVPIELQEGRGAVVAFTDIEDRVRAERELRERDEVLAAEQASLRRVAALVAGGAASAEVLAAIAREVGQVIGMPMIALWRYGPGETATVIGAWSEDQHPFVVGTRWPLDGPTICAKVLKTGRPARIEDFADIPGTIADAARKTGIGSCAGAPIIVDGRVWGAMSADSTGGAPLPDGIEDRLAEFTELVATAISNTASREALVRLADEQAALRRVATLVAQGVSSPEVFAAVAREVGLLLGVDATHMARYEVDGTATGVAAWSPAGDHKPVGTRVDTEGESTVAIVRRTERPARMHSYEKASGPAAALARELGLRSSVGAPIVVDQRLWGVMIVSSKDDQPLPADTESRIAGFTELVATAISNTEARAEAARLSNEQAALRRVATLVAQSVPPSELFGTAVEEAGKLFGAGLAGMIRYVADDAVIAAATWAAQGEHPEVRGVWPLEGDRLATAIFETGRATREDAWDSVSGPIADFVREVLGVRSSVGSPIVVEGRVWGALFVHATTAQPLPRTTESRLANFTELVGTAVANAQARADVGRLVDEQAALRRVATLVARESPSEEVFEAVAREAGQLLGVDAMHMGRFADGEAISVAGWSRAGDHLAVGTRVELDGTNVASVVFQSGQPARIDGYSAGAGPTADRLRQRMGVYSSVAVPIVVDRQLWGLMIASSKQQPALPADTESRLLRFTTLAETAIANAEARAELAASRARLVAAADEERRRVVRDLHDGAQQRLVHTIVTLKLAQEVLQANQEEAPGLVAEALDHAQRATDELRELSRGILPTVLTRGGLREAVQALASRTPVPVEVTVSADRLPSAVEATAYFVVAEALTNVAKHAGATGATVLAHVEAGTLQVRVRDDGAGGARPEGSGLVGLADRLAALDGQFRIESPAGGGTLVAADIPLRSP
jgi:PAS domain S-box-containing protein